MCRYQEAVENIGCGHKEITISAVLHSPAAPDLREAVEKLCDAAEAFDLGCYAADEATAKKKRELHDTYIRVKAALSGRK